MYSILYENGGDNMLDIVKDRRLALGITQAELANKSGVSRATVSDIENGKKVSIKTETLMRLAEALGVKVKDFFT